ncbi:MAG: 3-oxoacyl-ACP reductase family protein [Archaeoglobaceae archaeon]
MEISTERKGLESSMAGKVALVTGASRGIGKGIAIALARLGVNVGVHFHSYEGGADDTCSQIKGIGSDWVKVQADVSRSEDVAHLVETVERELGTIQILVNNAGIVHREELEKLQEEDWDRVMDINLKSAFLVTQACLKGMRTERWGRIINLTSVAAQTGGITSPIYVASKAGIIGLTHSYASMLVNEGITVNSISPALIETDMVTKDLKATPAPIPLGRFGKVEEVAEVAVMLVKNSYITGQTINVNGGWYFS